MFILLKYFIHGLVLNNILTAQNFKKGHFCFKKIALKYSYADEFFIYLKWLAPSQLPANQRLHALKYIFILN